MTPSQHHQHALASRFQRQPTRLTVAANKIGVASWPKRKPDSSNSRLPIPTPIYRLNANVFTTRQLLANKIRDAIGFREYDTAFPMIRRSGPAGTSSTAPSNNRLVAEKNTHYEFHLEKTENTGVRQVITTVIHVPVRNQTSADLRARTIREEP